MIPIEVIISVLSPIIGAFLGIIKSPKQSLVYHLLAFAGGIMLAVSFMDLIPASLSIHYLNGIFGLTIGYFLMYLIHLVIPHGKSLKDTGIYLALGMGIHNLSEGMAIGIASHISSSLSLVVTISIVIHNVAEGLCTVSPLYYCTKNKRYAFIITTLTAFPLLIGYLLVTTFFHDLSRNFLGLLLASTAGFMLNITMTELIPVSSYKESNFSTEFSLLIGIIIVMYLTSNPLFQ